MTLILERPVQGPATHAFVIGVGSYPDAKPGKGAKPELRMVSDIASAADGAKLMSDWLIENQDRLAAPLASLELLVGEADYPVGADPYPWANPKAVAEPTAANVKASGKSWVKRLKANPGSVALFYACGHGARLGSKPLLFLKDLNNDDLDAWRYLNVGQAAEAFKQLAEISAAFFFLDACQEFSPQLELSKTEDLAARFIAPLDPFKLQSARDKVALLCATSDGLLAYEGLLSPDSKVRIGRFTQTLKLALSGASVRWSGGRWIVDPGGLLVDLKPLHRNVRPEWRDQLFEPSQPVTPNEAFPIVAPADPLVPVLVTTDPIQAMGQYDLVIFASPDRTPPRLAVRTVRTEKAWLAWIKASRLPHYAVAEAEAAIHQEMFVPNAPLFDQRIPIA